MSSIDSALSGETRDRSDNIILKIWENHIRGILFGVLYAMTKENALGTGFMVASTVFEFLQMTIFCFRAAYHWGGFHFHFDLDASVIGYYAYTVIFWILLSLLALAFANAFYIGYTFYKGEVRSIYLLKMLRWVVSLFISVLFLPILFVLFSGLACDYSSLPARLLLYPTQECWGNHTAIGVVAIALAIIFSVLSLVATMTYYEHDPTMPKSSARLQNRFELAALFTKLVLVIVTVFLMENHMAFAVVSFASSLFLTVASIVMLPFYEIKLNMVRSGSYAGIFWVNVWMMIALVLNDDENIITTVCGIVGVPFAIAAGSFIAYRRFQYLCDPALVDGYVSSTDEKSPVPEKEKKGKKVKKGVNWEQPKANKLMKNHLYSRLLFPWDVEIAARFVHVGKPNAAMIEKGKAVYQTGISKFPKSPTVLQAYANFMFTTVGDWQLGYVMLEKLRKMNTMIDIQFFVYRYDKDRERRIEGGSERIGDFVDFMEYKKMQQAARRHHMTSLVCVRKFWSYLLESKVDVMELSVLSGRIANAEKKASEQYAKLVQNHPKNVRVLRDYARFLDEVVQDEVAAQEYRKKANKYEQREMEKLTDSVRSSYGNIPEVPLNELILPASDIDAEDEIQTEQRTSTVFTTTIDETDPSSKNVGGSQARLMSAKLDKHSSLKKLGYIMLGTTVFVLVIVLAELGILNNQFASYKYAVDSQNGAGGAAHTVVRVARGLADAVAIGREYRTTGDINASLMWTGDYAHLQSGTRESIIVVGNNLKALYWGTSQMSSFSSQRLLKLRRKFHMPIQINTSDHKMKYGEFDHVNPHRKAVEKFFNDPIYNATIYVPDNTIDFSTSDRTYKKSDLWSMCSIFLSVAEEVSVLPVSAFTDLETMDKYAMQFNYAIENSPEVAVGMHALVSLYAKNVEESLDRLLITCLIMFVVSVALLLLGSLLIFRPIVQQIFTSKVRTFSMFTLIPRDVVKMMSKKKIITLGLSESSNSGDEMMGFSDADSDGASVKKRPHKKVPNWSSKNLAVTKPTNKAIKKAASAPQLDTTTDDERESAVLHTPRAKDTNDMKMLLPNASDFLGSDAEPESDSGTDGGTAGGPFAYSNTKKGNSNGNANTTHQGSDTVRTANFTASDSGRIAMDSSRDGPMLSVQIPNNDESSETDDDHDEAEHPSTFQKLKRQFSAIAFKLPKVRSRATSYKKVGKHEAVSPSEKEKAEKEKEKAKKVSRLDVSSLRAVTWKLHFSYLIAIACIIVALCVSYLLTRVILGNLVKIASDLRSSDFRTQYAQVLALDIATLTVYPHSSITAQTAARHATSDFIGMWEAYNSVNPMSYQMDYMFTSDCLKIDEEKCPKPGDPFYAQQEYGFSNLFFNFFFAGKEVFDKYSKTNTTLAYDDPLYIEFRTLSETVFDGMEYLTFTVYVDALRKINQARNYVSIITAVECIVVALIYIILFRPFVRQLREENNHTFSIIRMIPKKLLRDVPEIHEFIRETLEPENEIHII